MNTDGGRVQLRLTLKLEPYASFFCVKQLCDVLRDINDHGKQNTISRHFTGNVALFLCRNEWPPSWNSRSGSWFAQQA